MHLRILFSKVKHSSSREDRLPIEILKFITLNHTFFFRFIALEIWYQGVFGVADYESELKIQ